MPQIGEIERGVWLASGFGGHGLNTTAMGGELVARGIVDADQTWRMFAPYELVWAGGMLASVLAQGIYWGTRPVEEHRARPRALSRAGAGAQGCAAGRAQSANGQPKVEEAVAETVAAAQPSLHLRPKPDTSKPANQRRTLVAAVIEPPPEGKPAASFGRRKGRKGKPPSPPA